MVKFVLCVVLSLAVLSYSLPSGKHKHHSHSSTERVIASLNITSTSEKPQLKLSSVYIIDTPARCGLAQRPDGKGGCREVWRRSIDKVEQVEEKIEVDEQPKPRPQCIIDCGIPPRDCPEGQKPDANGVCRDEWGKAVIAEEKEDKNTELQDDAGLEIIVAKPACIIDCAIPPRDCPEGQKPDANGVCREEWGRAVAAAVSIDVKDIEVKNSQLEPECTIDCGIPPRDCPEGQKPDANGNCRDEWGKATDSSTKVKRDHNPEPDCIIDCAIPPRDCPEGQLPDANGECRDIWGRFRSEGDRVKLRNIMLKYFLESKKNEDNDSEESISTYESESDSSDEDDGKVRCAAGQKMDQFGICRDSWIFSIRSASQFQPSNKLEKSISSNLLLPAFNVIQAPTRCPPGYQIVNGKCREPF